ncbi:MAG: N-formylglutamate amidohydrolase [Deltaproteobacteria bacterium]|nr:N-formylglutamate amidohydrolase [Deltaproteobacteria bacterium]
MFTLERPRGPAGPVLVEVPHAGLRVPEDVLGVLAAPPEALRRDADLLVDELYAGCVERGAARLVAGLSRYVVDLNRDEDDVDELTVEGLGRPGRQCPRGVLWRQTADGAPALSRPLSLAEYHARLERYYRPYHRALEDELQRLRARYGRAVLLAAHSMPSVGRSGRADAWVRRADVVPGTRGRSTAAGALIDVVDRHFRAAGLTVRHDEPYRGGATTARWGRPSEGLHAIQVELNRGLYLDEVTGARRPEGFRWLSLLCDALVSRLVEASLALPC